MDAFTIAMADGLKDCKIKIRKMFLIAFTFAIFQGVMPLIGYFVGHAVLNLITSFIPYITFTILFILGIKMIIDSLQKDKTKHDQINLTFTIIFFQSIATSLDALSVGFTMANYTLPMALISVFIIAIITFVLCFLGVAIGKKFGTKLETFAEVFGGIILIIIGLQNLFL